MLLYDYHNAPNPRVVRMFAAEKGIALEKRRVDVVKCENHRPPYNTGINRTGQVPALQLDNGRVICEILPICEYLEEVHPQPAVIGATAEERAETRMWTRWIDLKYVERMTEVVVTMPGPIREHYARYNLKTMPPPEHAEVCERMAVEKLEWFAGEMQGQQFVCGDRFTLADIHLFVFMDFFEHLGRRYPRELGWLGEHYERVRQRPSARA